MKAPSLNPQIKKHKTVFHNLSAKVAVNSMYVQQNKTQCKEYIFELFICYSPSAKLLNKHLYKDWWVFGPHCSADLTC